MKPLRIATALIFTLGFIQLGCPLGEAQHAAKADFRPMEPYLTWQGDTSTTMTVNFQTADPVDRPTVRYATQEAYEQTGAYGQEAQGRSWQIAGLQDGRYIHSVELTSLLAGTRYVFVVGEGGGASTQYAFVTIPNDGRSIRFVTGGDMGTYDLTQQLMRHAAALDPAFALIGGDLAYANGNLDDIGIWDAWLAYWFDIMVTSDDALIPMVLAIGNHETNSLEGSQESRAPFYFGFFPQGGKSYFSRSFGPHLALFVLDTGHVVPYEGPQTEWLAQAFLDHEAYPHKIAAYHIPLYPSHRPFLGRDSVLGRETWQPLFDAHDLDIAFENHDHAHKRSFPMRASQCNPAGTVYLGDGCFGKSPRSVAHRWYLAATSSTPHFWSVEVSETGLEASAIDKDGLVFDRSP